MLSSLPEGGPPAKREDLERVVRLVQRKDHHGIFKEPVTEEVVRGRCTFGALVFFLGSHSFTKEGPG